MTSLVLYLKVYPSEFLHVYKVQGGTSEYICVILSIPEIPGSKEHL